MRPPAFSLLYDYRCPFARNIHEHVLAAQAAGMELEVSFEPFTLSQGHVPEGAPDVWDDPSQDAALLALEVSVAVRDTWPAHFGRLHARLFAARHVDGISLTTRPQLADELERLGLSAEAVFEAVDGGDARRIIAERWRHFHDDLDVFGVPTFVVDDADATFVRLMEGPDPADPTASVAVVERLLDIVLGHPEINELKHTRLSR